MVWSGRSSGAAHPRSLGQLRGNGHFANISQHCGSSNRRGLPRQAAPDSRTASESDHGYSSYNLAELEAGHSGEEVAKHGVQTMEWYGFRARLGFITGDNHGANDTLCRAVAEAVPEWSPVDNCLCCLGHIINLAVQAFLFAKDKYAINRAKRQSRRSNRDIDEEIALASVKSQEGWSTLLLLQKLHAFCAALNRSSALSTAFKKLCKRRTIHSPNITRWNSWWHTITSAIVLQFQMSSFVHDNPQLSTCELSQAEWRLLRDTEHFFQPFKEQTKRCEGDNVTLDHLQESMPLTRWTSLSTTSRSSCTNIAGIGRSSSVLRLGGTPWTSTTTLSAGLISWQPGSLDESSLASDAPRSSGRRSTKSWEARRFHLLCCRPTD